VASDQTKQGHINTLDLAASTAGLISVTQGLALDMAPRVMTASA